MDKKTVLVVSRHPHLEDVRKHVLEEAGYLVITIRSPEQVEEACKNNKIDLAVIGYSVPTAEKQLIAAEIAIFCKCAILELWDREPPQLRVRGGSKHVFDHFSLKPDDFLNTVHSILRGTPSK
jgi:DNA-binding response OmpR family regulator